MNVGHSVIGVLLNNQWSVGGNPAATTINAFLAQPFANYNLAHGWYLNTSPIITGVGAEPFREEWTVPVGGGFGRVFRVGDQPINASIQVYYNAIRSTGAPRWSLRATLALLFPVK